MKKVIPASELIINEDGTCFHLHLRPEQVADRVILVGDPGRVQLVAKEFENVECEVSNREFHTITGQYQDKRITVISTGIGCDNIDIVVNEIDSLVNIDYNTRTVNDQLRSLSLVRIGTCGGLQPDIPIGSYVASLKSIGFDGLLNYYDGRDEVCDLPLEEAFRKHMNWSAQKGAPYVATANEELIDRIAGTDMVRGITIACGGFYGPQGRQLRLKVQDPEQNEKIRTFRYPADTSRKGINSEINELKICNFEMESSALAGLASLLGHKAMTCCIVLANRYAQEMNTNYKNQIEDLIKLVLNRI